MTALTRLGGDRVQGETRKRQWRGALRTRGTTFGCDGFQFGSIGIADRESDRLARSRVQELNAGRFEHPREKCLSDVAILSKSGTLIADETHVAAVVRRVLDPFSFVGSGSDCGASKLVAGGEAVELVAEVQTFATAFDREALS